MIKHISIIHIYLYGLIKREAGGGNIIHISKVHPIIKWYIRLPKKYLTDITREMIELGLLKKINRDKFEIMNIHRRLPPTDYMGEPLW